MNRLDSRGFRLGFATFVLFTGIAGDFWRDLTSWYGFGAVVAIAVAGSVVTAVRNRSRLAFLPYPLLAFLALAVLSIAWSGYRLESLGGVLLQLLTSLAAIAVAVSLSWSELLTVLGRVFRLVLGLSFVFEFVVSAFIRHPVYPVWVVPPGGGDPAKLLYWSRDLLFSFGKIQGIVGNSSLLGMAALLGLIVFAIQLASRSVGRFWGWFWIAVSALAIVITLSATIFIGVVVVVIVFLAVLLVRRAPDARHRSLTYVGIVVTAAIVAVVGVVFRTQIVNLLGKKSDFTGRDEIWSAVVRVAEQRPAAGWGWIGYWVPWASPFDDPKLLFVKAGGVQVLHAHNAWLDVFLQLGILGLIVFSAFVLSTFVRSWLMAVDRTGLGRSSNGAYSWVSLLPVLLLTAQLVQSLAESRILIEGGWMLLVVWSVMTKPTPLGERTAARPATLPAGRHPSPAEQR